MRIIATQTITHADGRAPTRPGQVVDLPETHARVMIGRGMAKRAPKPTPKPTPEPAPASSGSKRASRKTAPAPTNTDAPPDTTEAP